MDPGGRQLRAGCGYAITNTYTVGEDAAEALQLGAEKKEAFQRAHERLPRVFELLAVFTACSDAFQTAAAFVASWPFLRWLPQALDPFLEPFLVRPWRIYRRCRC